jgi:adenosylcobyric acid synthase
MIDCAAKVEEELKRGDIGPDRECSYYPCHFRGQNCSLCFCPFYPCEDPELGRSVDSNRGGKVWSCIDCYWIHRSDVVTGFFSKLDKDKGHVPGREELLQIKKELEEVHFKDAKRVMVMGATSGAGKSLLVTAICRHFSDLGLRVAPFKSQNMSLNSTVTINGEEIARAQDLQARAARVEPTAHMNPILLKPIKDNISQVIVEGHPYRDMDVRTYYEDFALIEGIEIIKRNLSLLRRTNDIIVIEGAGSPAEINMMEMDITNMRTAELADAVCYLVVNIEWGGAFAYAYGTLMLLSEEQRGRFKGTIITNLYGSKDSLRSGEEFLLEGTGVPVLGILPHLELDLPDEDSMFIGSKASKGGDRRIGVIRLPRISNFTDFDALSLSNVEVEYVERPERLDAMDAVIIPGTKNTVADLAWMREKGFDRALIGMAGKKPILGICGGYQILGTVIDDSKGIEGGMREIYPGLGLLQVRSSFELYEKRTVQVTGHLLVGDGAPVRGYEIHMGRTTTTGGTDLFQIKDMDGIHNEGNISDDGMVMGTYLHGVFDLPSFRRFFLSKVKGTVEVERPLEDQGSVVEQSLELLARALEKNVDMTILHGHMGLKGVRR